MRSLMRGCIQKQKKGSDQTSEGVKQSINQLMGSDTILNQTPQPYWKHSRTTSRGVGRKLEWTSSWHRAVRLFPFVMLSACNSVGVQYASPTGEQPSAELSMRALNPVRGDSLIINTFDQDGCYAGRMAVPYPGIKLHPGKEMSLTYEGKWRQSGNEMFCRVMLSFTPEKDVTYQVVAARSSMQTGATNLFDKPVNQDVCTASIQTKDRDGNMAPVSVTYGGLKQTKLTCIKLVPKEPQKSESAVKEGK